MNICENMLCRNTVVVRKVFMAIIVVAIYADMFWLVVEVTIEKNQIIECPLKKMKSGLSNLIGLNKIFYLVQKWPEWKANSKQKTKLV